jgi:aldehyde dehydrogenase (NAD(P)+)
VDGEHSFVAEELEAGLQALRVGATDWASMPLSRKATVLSACRRSTSRNASRWAQAAAQIKGSAEGFLAGGEAITGPWAVLSLLGGYIDTLAQIERSGTPALEERRIRSRPNGQLVVEVFPAAVYDRFLQIGLRAEVWMQPGVTREALPATMGVWYRRPNPTPRLCLVLGAGNVTSIGPLDVLYKLVAEGCACMLKIHPLFEKLGPIFEDALAPLVARGYLRFAYGGAEVGRYLCQHPEVDEIHITGGQATYDAIAAANATHKPITSELGNVSPAIVVPGQWSDWELRFQAEHLATAKLHNGGFNCIALQVLILPEQWSQRAAFLAEIRHVFESTPQRAASYPGSAQRYEALRAGRVAASRIIVEAKANDADEALFNTEAFCPLLAVVTIPSSDVNGYLRDAVAFCNDRLAGNLAANVIVDARAMREYRREIDDAVAALRYGCIGVNVWSGVGFLLPPLPWGAYPGNTPERIRSGIGVVHNSRLFSSSQKSVLYSPFVPPLRRLKPPWFVSHRNQAKIGMALCDLEFTKSPLALARIGWLTLTG